MTTLVLICVSLLGGEPAPEDARELDPLARLEGHERDVHAVAAGPGGRLLATASFDGRARVFTLDGREVAALEGHEGKIFGVTFSPDGSRLATAGEDRTVRLWALPQGEPRPIASVGEDVKAFAGAFGSAEEPERFAVVADAAALRIIDLESEAELSRVSLPSPARAVDGVIGPEAFVALLGEDRRLRIWSVAVADGGKSAVARPLGDGAKWRLERGKKAYPDGRTSPAFDDSGWEEAASGFGYSTNDAELATVKTRLDDMRGEGGYASIAVRALFEVADPGAVRRLVLRVIYDDGFVAWLNGKEVARRNVEGDPPAFDRFASSPGEPQEIELDLTEHRGLLASGRNVLSIQAHNANATSSDLVLTPRLGIESEAKPIPIGTLTPVGDFEAGDATDIAIGAESRSVAWIADGNVSIASLESGSTPRAIADRKATALSFLREGRIALGDGDGRITALSIDDPAKDPREIATLGAAIRALAPAAAADRLAVATEDGKIRLVELSKGDVVAEWADPAGAADLLAVRANGEGVVSTASGSVSVWRAGSPEAIGRSELPDVRSVGARGDEALALAGGRVLRFTPGPSRLLSTFTGHGGAVHAVAFSADGRILASAGADKRVILRDPASGSEIRRIDAHESSVYCLDFHPRGTFLVTGGYDSRVKLWKVDDGSLAWQAEGHLDGVTTVRFSPDGTSILSGGFDRTIRRFDVESGEATVLEGHPGWVMGLAFEDGGETFLSVDFGGHVLRWRAAGSEIVARFRLVPVLYGIAPLPDGRALVGGRDGTALIYDLSGR